MRAVVVAVVLAACGGPSDDCERIYDKLVASVPTFHKDEAKWLRSCRAEAEPPTSDPELRCTLEADSATAVRHCMHDRYDSDADALEKFGRQQEALAAEKAVAKAKAEADEAAKAAAEAMHRTEALERDLTDLTTKLDDAIRGAATVQNDIDRATARVRLEQLGARRAELERRIAEAKAAAARAQRGQGITVSKDCLDNPLAKGCP